jgi:hypothetical protein
MDNEFDIQYPKMDIDVYTLVQMIITLRDSMSDRCFVDKEGST